MIPGPIGQTGRDTGIVVVTHGDPISTQGGFVEPPGRAARKVQAGQAVAIQRNAFGDQVAECDATCEPGTPLMLILSNAEGPKEEEEFPE